MKNKQSGFTAVEIAMALAILALIAVAGCYAYQNYHRNSQTASATPLPLSSKSSSPSASPAKSASPTPQASLTNDQIFQEVASQLHLSRNSIGYFRIFGQDKVQYSTKTEGDNWVAYKVAGTWHKAYLGESIQSCSDYASVPEAYRPPCADANGHSLYALSDGHFANYPSSSMTSYIGE